LVVFLVNIYAAERIYALFGLRTMAARIGQLGVGLLIVFAAGSFVLPAMHPPVNLQHTYSPAEMNAFHFLKRTGSVKRVLSKYTDLYSPGDELNMSIQAFSGRSVVSEGVNYVFAYDERDPAYLKKLQEVREFISRFYTTSSPDSALAMIRKYDVEYIYLREPDRIFFDYSGILECVFDEKNIKIFKVGKSRSEHGY
jgi:uncharacterized membrane protein